MNENAENHEHARKQFGGEPRSDPGKNCNAGKKMPRRGGVDPKRLVGRQPGRNQVLRRFQIDQVRQPSDAITRGTWSKITPRL